MINNKHYCKTNTQSLVNHNINMNTTYKLLSQHTLRQTFLKNFLWIAFFDTEQIEISRLGIIFLSNADTQALI